MNSCVPLSEPTMLRKTLSTMCRLLGRGLALINRVSGRGVEHHRPQLAVSRTASTTSSIAALRLGRVTAHPERVPGGRRI